MKYITLIFIFVFMCGCATKPQIVKFSRHSAYRGLDACECPNNCDNDVIAVVIDNIWYEIFDQHKLTCPHCAGKP